jgi:hypothetical protein
MLGLFGSGLASVTLLSGCTIGGKPEPLPPVREPTPGVDPDVVVAGDTLAAERAMLDRVSATMARHTGLAPLLTPVAAVHQAHVELLTRAVPDSATSAASPSGSASPTTSPPGVPTGPTAASSSPSAGSGATTETVRVPRDPDRAVRDLARHEDALSLVDKQQAFTARSGAFARLLASMAAAAAQQAVVLAGSAHRSGGAR